MDIGEPEWTWADNSLSTHIYSSLLCYIAPLFVRFSGYPPFDTSLQCVVHVSSYFQTKVAWCALANDTWTELMCAIFYTDPFAAW
jgi:hypothetical protein